MTTILKISFWCLRRLKLLWEKREHDELDQECCNIHSTRGYIFVDLDSQNIENCLARSSHAIAILECINFKYMHLAFSY